MTHDQEGAATNILLLLNTSDTMVLQSSLIISVPTYNIFCYCNVKFACFCRQVRGIVGVGLGLNNFGGVTPISVSQLHLYCLSGATATQLTHFGPGAGFIFLDNVDCDGNEANLTQCRHRGFGIHNCRPSQDAGVFCSGGKPAQ